MAGKSKNVSPFQENLLQHYQEKYEENDCEFETDDDKVIFKQNEEKVEKLAQRKFEYQRQRTILVSHIDFAKKSMTAPAAISGDDPTTPVSRKPGSGARQRNCSLDFGKPLSNILLLTSSKKLFLTFRSQMTFQVNCISSTSVIVHGLIRLKTVSRN